jgi:hypothetical protein
MRAAYTQTTRVVHETDRVHVREQSDSSLGGSVERLMLSAKELSLCSGCLSSKMKRLIESPRLQGTQHSTELKTSKKQNLQLSVTQ